MFESDETFWTVIILTIVLAFAAGTYWALQAEAKQRAAFMAECQQERKHYECVAMWRQGESSVAPMPMTIIVPVR